MYFKNLLNVSCSGFFPSLPRSRREDWIQFWPLLLTEAWPTATPCCAWCPGSAGTSGHSRSVCFRYSSSLRYKTQPSGIYLLVRNWKVRAFELSFINLEGKKVLSNHGSCRLKVRNEMVKQTVSIKGLRLT